MRQLSKEVIADKEARTLFNPTVFKPKNEWQYRTLANFDKCYLLVLDIDGGDVTPQMIEDIFWNEAIGSKSGLTLSVTLTRDVLPIPIVSE
jgi:hypothetical protein